jgi:hypothetical protein
MAEYADREHYIPLRKSDLVELLCKDPRLSAGERDQFRQFCRLVSAVWHFEYLELLEELKDAYAPLDPDSETRPLAPLDAAARAQRTREVFDKFTGLMERANFKRLTPADIQQALKEIPSDWGIATEADLSVFEEIRAFARGDVMGERTRRLWWKLWRKETIKLPLHSRLVFIAKLRKHKRLDHDVDTDDVYLKIFKDIPKSDLDMLLPGTRVKLSSLDQAMIVYPLVTGIGLMLYNIFNQVLSAGASALFAGLGALASWTVAAAIAGYGYKSYYSYQFKKQTYNLRLTKSLYFLTLASNTSALMRLLDEAEEQECRETMLGYFYLWKYAPPEGWEPAQLDDYVELELEAKLNLKVDFEIGDALAKLERLQIVTQSGGRYRAAGIETALEKLDERWDNYFKYNRA